MTTNSQEGLGTDPVGLQPEDLPVPKDLPVANTEEESALSTVIEDWQKLVPLQQAVCLCLLRGDNTHEAIASMLGLKVTDVKRALKGVWGVLRDGNTGILQFK